MTDLAEFAREMESVVRSVPGVTAVYPATPVVVTVVATVVATVASTVSTAVSAVVGAGGEAAAELAKTPALVSVSTGKDGLRVAASIGVASGDSSTEVCRRVHDSIAESGGITEFTAIDTITVTVASID
ncbi:MULTISPECIES: hypothetical protein [Cryobacterium]|uniref:Asp23/Gls24 family envelope stress response protein n=1 Tax=Cryobacterium breve TaxID=1259258 RepID=A0ABY2J167_9MICO|nr:MULTISPECIES: hypothetical protein [Cryobacterium]TFC94106.1 hypothetical protein E3T20_09055 [Cryobacterium sp. TmT3-12]TFC98663.1 hypothetical protein E3O65_07235 [Cryobacterium breve]